MTINTKINKIKSSADRIITKSGINYYRINSWNYTLIHNKATFINIHILLRVKKEILKNKEYIHKKVDQFIRENRKILLLFKNEKINSFRIKFINIVDLFASEVVQIPIEADLSKKQLNILMALFDGPKKTATLAKTYKLGNSKKAYVFLKALEKRKWIYRHKPEGQRTVEWTLKNKSDKYSFSEWFLKYIETKKPEYYLWNF